MALQLLRTANAGVLLTMDGMSILLDGVCGEIPPYLPTPDDLRKSLQANYPDIVAFTHAHGDHYDHAFATAYQEKTLRPIFGPEVLPCGGMEEAAVVKSVKITPVPSRHIGKARDAHISFVLQGSQCVWFVGDAAPSQWLNRQDLPKPDLLIAPYAYALTDSAWKATCSLAEKVVLLHLPEPGNDPAGLWSGVESVLSGTTRAVCIPSMGQKISDKATVKE